MIRIVFDRQNFVDRKTTLSKLLKRVSELHVSKYDIHVLIYIPIETYKYGAMLQM